MATSADLAAIWRQNSIPVIYRGAKASGAGRPLLVKLPVAPGNGDWLQWNHTRHPRWNDTHHCWECPAAWLDELVRRIARRYSSGVYLIQPYREKSTCAPACWNAKGFECECSCMGVNHGNGQPGGSWYTVSEAYAVSWQGRELSYRLIRLAEAGGTRPMPRTPEEYRKNTGRIPEAG